jgi:hypothetical protein
VYEDIKSESPLKIEADKPEFGVSYWFIPCEDPLYLIESLKHLNKASNNIGKFRILMVKGRLEGDGSSWVKYHSIAATTTC